MTFRIDVNIPAAGNDPSDDQPLMQTNFSNINSYVQVDHVNPSDTGAGQHKQVTINANNVPIAPVNPKSILYTNAGTASSNSQLFWRNADSIFHISPIRAWGVFDASGTPISSESFNITSVTRPSTGNYVVTIAAGATSSSNYAVLVTPVGSSGFSTAGSASYTVTTQTSFQVNIKNLNGSGGLNTGFSVMVLQI